MADQWVYYVLVRKRKDFEMANLASYLLGTVERETAKAILFSYDKEFKSVWIPKSVISETLHVHKDYIYVSVKQWFRRNCDNVDPEAWVSKKFAQDFIKQYA